MVWLLFTYTILIDYARSVQVTQQPYEYKTETDCVKAGQFIVSHNPVNDIPIKTVCVGVQK